VPDPRRPLPPDRPDPAALLIDAVIQRQQPLALRLAQQWVHRRGWTSFAEFVHGVLLRSCGEDGIAWLQQGLGRVRTAVDSAPAAAANTTVPPQASAPLQQLIREALSEAVAPLRDTGTATSSAPKGVAPAGVLQPENDPWQLPELITPQTLATDKPAVASPAPPPANLAGLRAWLHSDAA